MLNKDDSRLIAQEERNRARRGLVTDRPHSNRNSRDSNPRPATRRKSTDHKAA